MLEKIIDKGWVKTLLLIGSLFYTLVFVVAGTGYTWDSTYWMDLYVAYDISTSTICLGTMALAHGWIYLFGNTLFSMRLLSWLCVVGGIALPYLCLLDNAAKKANLHYLALAFCLMGGGTLQEFNPYSISVLLVAAIAVVWVKNLEDRRWVLAIPLITAMAIVARFPNIVVVAVLAVVAIGNGIIERFSVKRILVEVIWLVFGTVVFAFIMFELLGCHFSDVVLSFSNSATGSHSMDSLIKVLLDTGIDVVISVSIVFLFGWLAVKSDDNWPSWAKVLSYILLMLGLLYVLIQLCIKRFGYPFYMVSALTLVIALIVSIGSLGKRDWRTVLSFLALPLMGFVVPLGSDVGWWKLFPMLLCFLPYFLAEGHVEQALKRKVSVLLVEMAFFLMIFYVTNPIAGNSSLMKARAFGVAKFYQYTLVTKAENRKIQQYLDDFQKYGKSGNTIAIGNGCHMFNQVCQLSPYTLTFWENVNEQEYVVKNLPFVKEHRPVVFLFINDGAFFERTGKSLFEKEVELLGYNCVDRSDWEYLIYVPFNKQNESCCQD